MDDTSDPYLDGGDDEMCPTPPNTPPPQEEGRQGGRGERGAGGMGLRAANATINLWGCGNINNLPVRSGACLASTAQQRGRTGNRRGPLPRRCPATTRRAHCLSSRRPLGAHCPPSRRPLGGSASRVSATAAVPSSRTVTVCNDGTTGGGIRCLRLRQ